MVELKRIIPYPERRVIGTGSAVRDEFILSTDGKAGPKEPESRQIFCVIIIDTYNQICEFLFAAIPIIKDVGKLFNHGSANHLRSE